MKRSKKDLNEMRALRDPIDLDGFDAGIGPIVRIVLYIAISIGAIYAFVSAVQAPGIVTKADRFYDNGSRKFYDDGSREFYDTGRRKFYDNGR